MKLALALAVLGVTAGSAFGSTTAAVSSHGSAFIPTLASVGMPVPEPATLGILGVGAAAIVLRRSRNRNNLK
jgi:hypothetical protein